MSPRQFPEGIKIAIAKHAKAFAEIGTQLAMNFDAPAQRIINAGFARLGLNRFERNGDDLWEMYIAWRDGTEYNRPSRQLRERWASY